MTRGRKKSFKKLAWITIKIEAADKKRIEEMAYKEKFYSISEFFRHKLLGMGYHTQQGMHKTLREKGKK